MSLLGALLKRGRATAEDLRASDTPEDVAGQIGELERRSAEIVAQMEAAEEARRVNSLGALAEEPAAKALYDKATQDLGNASARLAQVNLALEDARRRLAAAETAAAGAARAGKIAELDRTGAERLADVKDLEALLLGDVAAKLAAIRQKGARMVALRTELVAPGRTIERSIYVVREQWQDDQGRGMTVAIDALEDERFCYRLREWLYVHDFEKPFGMRPIALAKKTPLVDGEAAAQRQYKVSE